MIIKVGVPHNSGKGACIHRIGKNEVYYIKCSGGILSAVCKRCVPSNVSTKTMLSTPEEVRDFR